VPVDFDEGGISSPVKVLDEAFAAGRRGRAGLPFWMSFRLEGGRGCYGLQIDGPAFSRVVVVKLAA
jgi:hypothetical protein